MKKIVLLSLLFIYSCSPGTVVVNPSENTNIQQNNNQNKFSDNQSGGLKFNPISEQNANLLNSQNRNNSSTSPKSPQGGNTQEMAGDSAMSNVPSVAPAAGSAVGRSDVYGNYLNSQNPFEEYIISDYQEAKTNGFNGSLMDGYNKIVKPIIKDWANDAKATYIFGNFISSGNLENQENLYPVYPLQYTYVSPSKKEVYSVFISPKETLVLRQKWILKNLVDANIKIDSKKAIEVYTSKVKDKNYNAEYDNNNLGPNSQPLYEIPANSYWTFYLSQEKDYLIWNINLNYSYPTISPMPVDKAYTNTWYSGGYAKINAQTGELISMSRPVKYTETVQPQPDIYQVPEAKPVY